jgi:endonuclease VIII
VPEGDTVFRVGRRLDEALAGRVLVRAELRHPSLSTIDLTGRVVLGVATVGKHLLTRLDDGRTLHSHLRMDGSWHLYRPGRSWRGPRHEVRAVMGVADRVAVGYRLHDLALLPTAHEDRMVGHLGPDLLHPDWGPELAGSAAARLAARPDRELGLALLDQTVMAGVGNIYRSEVCFLLGVSPWTPVSEVDPAAVVAVAHTLLEHNAWLPERSTTGSTGPGGHTWVSGRDGRPCRKCRTPVRSARQSDPHNPVYDRTVYFCPHCQPTPGTRAPAVAAQDLPRRRPPAAVTEVTAFTEADGPVVRIVGEPGPEPDAGPQPGQAGTGVRWLRTPPADR